LSRFSGIRKVDDRDTQHQRFFLKPVPLFLPEMLRPATMAVMHPFKR
jgi:hypothetical protein